MKKKQIDIAIRQQRLLLKARVAIAFGETTVLAEVERELENLSALYN